MRNSDVLIVGGGLCGLLAGLTLQRAGRQVVILDKGRTVGGRLATRSIGPGLADYGAQFFTVREPAFRHYVDGWQAAGLVYSWSTGWSDGSLVAGAVNDGYPRYAVHGGMNALAQTLAAEFMALGGILQTDSTVTAVHTAGQQWHSATTDGAYHQAATLVLTPPVPQALALLAAGATPLQPEDEAALAKITYAPCLCALFQVEGAVNLPEPGALQRPGADISWIADNQRKGISPEATTITVHAGPAYSERHYATPDQPLLSTLQASLLPFLASKSKVRAAELKRWRYALPTVIHPARYLEAQSLPPLFFGGDAFGGPRVEGAALSGLAIGERILAHFTA
ncbi:MAG: FAD-dependent oxidoreductase [Caldilineaceae bacterium]